MCGCACALSDSPVGLVGSISEAMLCENEKRTITIITETIIISVVVVAVVVGASCESFSQSKSDHRSTT